MKNIKVKNIIKTSYDYESFWIEYEVDGKLGYEITDDTYKELEKHKIELEYNSNVEKNYNLSNKVSLKSMSNFLSNIINMCRLSENDMYFIEKINEVCIEDIESKDSNTKEVEKFILNITEEAFNLGIEEYIKFYEDDCIITVYGGVLTKVLF